MRFTASEKLEIIRLVEDSELGVRRTLKELGIHRSTFYNWYSSYQAEGFDGLQPCPVQRNHHWNRIPDPIRGKVIDLALEFPELSPRWIYHTKLSHPYHSKGASHITLNVSIRSTTPSYTPG